MNPFIAIVVRDLKLTMRTGGNTLTVLAFYLAIGVIMPLTIGPDKAMLAQLGPALIWIGVLLSVLLGLDRMFVADHEDGSLSAMRHAAISLETISFAKLIVHWLVTAFPLILITPFMAILFFMDMQTLLRTLISLALGTPALVALGGIGAAVAVSLRRGGMLAPILIMPLAVPTIIFGIGAIQPAMGANSTQSAVLLLAAISLVTVAFAPFAIALALRLAAE